MPVTVATFDPFSLIAAPVVGALVAILFTGKITTALARRSAARVLRGRLARVLLLGPAREQTPWWYASEEDLTGLGARLIALGDEAVAIDVWAAEAIWHAGQMIPVISRCRDSYIEHERDVGRAIDKAGLNPDDHDTRQVKKAIEGAIEVRDDALNAAHRVYRDLLDADHRLANASRWVRIIDPAQNQAAPASFGAAADFAAELLHGAKTWQEPAVEELEKLRVRSIAIKIPPPSNIDRIDDELPRRNLLGPNDEVVKQLPGRRSWAADS